jgi:hypothetical protein
MATSDLAALVARHRIGLGTGPQPACGAMVTASAIDDRSRCRVGLPRRDWVHGRTAMGQPAMRWADLAVHVGQIRALLAGEVVDIDGRACQMLHADGWGAARPMAVPLWVAPTGPKGFRTARDMGADGVMLVGLPPEGEVWERAAMIVHGTVVRDGEDHTSARVVEAAGPWFATTFHALWEFSPDLIDAVPGGAVWRDHMVMWSNDLGRNWHPLEGVPTTMEVYQPWIAYLGGGDPGRVDRRRRPIRSLTRRSDRPRCRRVTPQRSCHRRRARVLHAGLVFDDAPPHDGLTSDHRAGLGATIL